MKSVLISIVSILVTSVAFAEQVTSSCHEQAKIKVQKHIKTLATKILNPEGQSIMTLEVEAEPYFIFSGDNPENFLGKRESAFTVHASIDDSVASEKELPTRFIAGFLFTRCSLENPNQVEKIWFQRDAVAVQDYVVIGKCSAPPKI